MWLCRNVRRAISHVDDTIQEVEACFASGNKYPTDDQPAEFGKIDPNPGCRLNALTHDLVKLLGELVLLPWAIQLNSTDLRIIV